MKRMAWVMGLLLAVALSWTAAASAKLSDADACKAAKLRATAKYSSCRLKAEAKALATMVPADYTRCDAKLVSSWNKIESTFDGACASLGDLAAVQGRVIGDTGLVNIELGGTAPTILRRMPASGELLCYDGNTHTPIPCAGTGQDGEFLAGVARKDEFKDNGDGTISDIVTGIMWEKKTAFDNTPDAANLHDTDNRYPWAGQCSELPATFCYSDAECPVGQTCEIVDGQGGAMTVFDWVAKLNEGTGFAGYTDWRLANVRELGTITCYGTCSPASPKIFHMANCGTPCTDITDPECSCTAFFAYWSSTTCNQFPPSVWWVDFVDGRVDHNNPQYPAAVRAVRGGL